MSMNSNNKFYTDFKYELSRVSWPGRETIVRATIVILIITFLSVLYVAMIDGVVNYGFEFIKGLRN